MHLSAFVEMVESGFDDRVLLGDQKSRITGTEFGCLVRLGATQIHNKCASVIYVGENHSLLPVALFAAAWAGVPFVPANYRLEDRQLHLLIERYPNSLVLTDPSTFDRLTGFSPKVFDEWLSELSTIDLEEVGSTEQAENDDDVAVVLFTSGTTSEPKSALLRHRHLMAYLLGSVEFGSAESSEAVLVSVPPYHVAGIANMLSNLFSGRRLVYLQSFSAQEWLTRVDDEKITHAMVVPTMLSRIVEHLDGGVLSASTLRTLSYGGAKVSERVIRQALQAFPNTGFVNAYGLTETASTIAVLGPDDHRDALSSDDPILQRRLSSVGQVLPMVEIEVRDEHEQVVAAGESGLIYLRGEQVSGEYAGMSLLDDDGWFCTRDQGSIDVDGYLYIEGRVDDTIIRGGENIAPAEIESVLLAQTGIAEACVVGLPDDEWGQRIVAVVVCSEGHSVDVKDLQDSVRDVLRGSKTPEEIIIRDSLPHTETGKMLRRVVLSELVARQGGTAS
jgi:acyl-CoA synthetase (AMP-forming)/AMP-acid ligase II